MRTNRMLNFPKDIPLLTLAILVIYTSNLYQITFTNFLGTEIMLYVFVLPMIKIYGLLT